MTADAEARELVAALLDWMDAAPAGFTADGPTRAVRYGLAPAQASALERRFEELALALFAFQYERVPVYRAFCDALGRAPSKVRRSAEVPALPVEAFKRGRVAAFPPEREVAAFHTSGTTGSAVGVLHLERLDLYDRALERGFAHHVLPDRDTIRMLLLVASPEEAPHSSLSYMLGRVERRWGAPGSAWLYSGGEVRWPLLRAALEAARNERDAVCLLGTAFGWSHVLDACEREGFRIALPAGSRLFETGGTKGRSRELSRAALCERIERAFGVPQACVVGEYGMTELGSQLYTTSLRRALRGEPPADESWSYPAWLRPRLVEPESGAAVDPEAASETGLLAHHDLANMSTVAHVLTADLGRPCGPSFDLLGRCPRAEPRGCGLLHERGSARA